MKNRLQKVQVYVLLLGWDSTPDQSIIHIIWNHFKYQLSDLCSVNLLDVFPGSISNCHLPDFWDASMTGYCALIYFRCLTPGSIFI